MSLAAGSPNKSSDVMRSATSWWRPGRATCHRTRNAARYDRRGFYQKNQRYSLLARTVSPRHETYPATNSASRFTSGLLISNVSGVSSAAQSETLRSRVGEPRAKGPSRFDPTPGRLFFCEVQKINRKRSWQGHLLDAVLKTAGLAGHPPFLAIASLNTICFSSAASVSPNR